ncbi:conserved hypothetical protein [Altererythrobacter sp. B11]|uniref:cellulose biosynthesis protein BcsD n=1 Tax=Altererythrobacter sp. B11 TaxID=2060312 RepID=UPI000DC70816|nr:cellulose biosynthesis protein BcsD [Altererythrobacter sp. B11]BBC71894.1 conserved hypothetical protein [Altererythrobacter sp. B11]
MFVSAITSSTWSAADEERSLAILGRLMLEEIAGCGTAEQCRGLLVAIGRRLAGLLPVANEAELAVLAERINGFWATLKWGSVGFELDDEGIDIIHRGLPPPERDQLQDWGELLPPVLEGAYDHWFRQMGSDSTRLHTRVIRTAAGQVELRHGL